MCIKCIGTRSTHSLVSVVVYLIYKMVHLSQYPYYYQLLSSQCFDILYFHLVCPKYSRMSYENLLFTSLVDRETRLI